MLKTAYINKPGDSGLSYQDMRTTALEYEGEGNLDAAAALYIKCIKVKPKDEIAYNRLMIIYRKQKNYTKEIALIKQGIKVYELLYSNKKKVNSAVSRLSKSILKSTGLTNSKGKSHYEQQPITKWRKRLEGLNKKLKK